MLKKRTARVFQESTGLYYYSDDRLPYLDARGRGFPSKRLAMEAAYMAGFTHAVGSGVYRRGASILSQVPSAREFAREHEWANAEEEYYSQPTREGD